MKDFCKDDCKVAWVLDHYGEFPAGFSDNAKHIIRDQYFRNGEESFWDTISRVVQGILDAPRIRALLPSEKSHIAPMLCYGLAHQMFSFNSPVWYNLGVNSPPQCSACFIQPVEDDMDSIMELAASEARLFKHGSGTGTNLSTLRASTERLSKSDGYASGPVSFMKGYDAFAGVIKSGGRTRRAAKMQLLDDWHPDLMKFIRAKADEDAKAKGMIAHGMHPDVAYSTVAFQNLNSSVRLSDTFMREATSRDDDYWLFHNVCDGASVSAGMSASDILDEIARAAWECGDPGVQFTDTINDDNMLAHGPDIHASNPCSEFVFIDNSACNLASINVCSFIKPDGYFDHEGFGNTVRLLIRCMDALVDLSGYPTEEIKRNSIAYRPLGLGMTNIGAALMYLGMPYGSPGAVNFVGQLGYVLLWDAAQESGNIAAKFGKHKDYVAAHEEDILREKLDDGLPLSVTENGLANAQLTLMAPTGTISFMMDCDTTGIEPVFAESATKKLASGETIRLVPACVKYAYDHMLDHCVVTAVGPKAATVDEHLNMMSALQPYMSGAISKTVNVPSYYSPSSIRGIYEQAWERGLKCIAIYRDGCKGHQPLNQDTFEEGIAKMEAEMKGGDPGEPIPSWDPSMLSPLAPVVLAPHRHRLPDERQAITHKFSVNGFDGYLTVGLYEDGRPGEIFVNVAKEGSTASGFMDAWATMVSVALQYGVPLSVIIGKSKGHRFEPSGFTTNKDIPTCTSLVDYIVTWLDNRFQEGGGSSLVADRAGSMDHAHIRSAVSHSGNVCPECGALTQQTGTCRTCPQCGWNGGCG